MISIFLPIIFILWLLFLKSYRLSLSVVNSIQNKITIIIIVFFRSPITQHNLAVQKHVVPFGKKETVDQNAETSSRGGVVFRRRVELHVGVFANASEKEMVVSYLYLIILWLHREAAKNPINQNKTEKAEKPNYKFWNLIFLHNARRRFATASLPTT